MTWRLTVEFPKRARYIGDATRAYAAAMERERYELKEQATHVANVVRLFLLHTKATVRVEEVTQ
jgi:hypothetical protein